MKKKSKTCLQHFIFSVIIDFNNRQDVFPELDTNFNKRFILNKKLIKLRMYRVFKETVGWSNALFIFPSTISFKEIINNYSTSFLTKKNYLGEFDFDDKFLIAFYTKRINNKIYYYLYSYEEDDSNEFTEM